MTNKTIVLAALLALLCVKAGPVWSKYLIISNAATHSVNCSNGVCTPHGPQPVLNVGDLETMLASGSVQVVVVGGKFGSKGRIYVKARLSWSALTTLTLQAAEDLYIDAPISVKGSGGLAIAGDFPQFSFGRKGKITFSNLSSSLTIGSISYTLIGTLPSLAIAIAANPSGNFALADSYDASADGTYSASPIATNFLGSLDGLGNAISNITVNDSSDCCVGGLFLSLSEASISDLRLSNVTVTSTGGAAGLAYESFAQISKTSLSGTITGGSTGDVGGFVSDNYGQIEGGYSTAAVSAASSVTGVNLGGLVGVNLGKIDEAFATGSVSTGDGSGNLGGLVGLQQQGGLTYQCYANGAVAGGKGMKVGGLLGWNMYNSGGGYSVQQSYSTGAVSGGSGSFVGGFIGENEGGIAYGYFDTTTSGTGVGIALGNASGVTGLTTEQLQSGLPTGFEQGVWAETSRINNGLPYLRYNPPPK